MKPHLVTRLLRRCLSGSRVPGDPKRTVGLQRADTAIKDDESIMMTDPDDQYPKECDVLVIGGGAIGCSVGYWLTKHIGTKVTVVERDPCYTRAASPLSVGGIRQQFSEPENIQLSLFGAEFLKNIKENLSVFDLDPPDIHFCPHGYLVLANEENAESLRRNNEVQRSLGAKVDLMSPSKIGATWPWLNVSDVALGSYGTENEGWFDPYLLLQSLKRKALSQGVQFVAGDLLDFEFSEQKYETPAGLIDKKVLKAALVKTPDNLLHSINFGVVVNAAGPWAGHVASLAGVGGFAGEQELPVRPRRQSVFVVSQPPSRSPNSPPPPGIDAPHLHDWRGLRLKREGFHGDFVTFVNPPPGAEAAAEFRVEREGGREREGDRKDADCNGEDLEPDYEFFDSHIWPRLAHRVPCMESVKVRNAWAGFYDFNSFDQNLIIGRHPYHRNLIFCNGSSGHGIQHAVGIGRAVSELVTYDRFKTIDLSRMDFARLEAGEKIVETGII